MQAAGLDPHQLCQTLGISPALLDTGMSLEDSDRFLCCAWDALDDPCIGLLAGSNIQPERFGIVGLAAMSSPDFGTALQRKARYWRLVWGDPYEVRLSANEAAAVLTPIGPVRPYTQAKVDMELASLVAFGRRFTGQHIAPVRLTLTIPAPAWRSCYESTFGCPVYFSHVENSVVFTRHDVALPLVSHNEAVAVLMNDGAEAALARLGDVSVRSQVEQAIDHMLQGGEPSLQVIAKRMHRSERTLQRQMAQEKIRFTDVLDQRRRLLAQRYLQSSKATTHEVAFLLGFATPSSFFRAFKRWTGLPPDEWRRTLAH